VERFDVAVVGGGPAGAVAARVAARAGARVLLVEQRERGEAPSACAGLVSPRTLRVLGASPACVVARPRRLTIHAPDGTTLSIATRDERALVVDRAALEIELLALAQAAGVDVRRGARAVAWRAGTLQMATAAGAHEARATTLVGADGPDSRVATWAGLPPGAALRARQAEIDVPASPDEPVRVFVGPTTAPGFFAWSVPAQSGRLRVGLAVRGTADPETLLMALLARHFAGARPTAIRDGLIPIPVKRQTARGEILLVGDAAGHVKPFSGGGLYFGGLCAHVAGHALARAARGDAAAREAAFADYERVTRALLVAETRFGARARRLCDALPDDDWSRLLRTLDQPGLVALLNAHADLDHLRRTARRVARAPRAWLPLARAWTLAAAVAGRRGADRVAPPRSESL